MPTYRGSCHCGAVRFEVDAVIDRVTECNCTLCAKKGILHHRVAPGNFRLLSPAQAVGLYQFGTRTAKHFFCPACGIHTHTNPRTAPDMISVNVRTLDDFDLKTANPAIVPFDGQNWEAAAARHR